jgi:hypothetical protein
MGALLIEMGLTHGQFQTADVSPKSTPPVLHRRPVEPAHEALQPRVVHDTDVFIQKFGRHDAPKTAHPHYGQTCLQAVGLLLEIRRRLRHIAQ